MAAWHCSDCRREGEAQIVALLVQVRLETLREARLVFNNAYDEQEDPLLGTMYGLKAIAELERAAGAEK